MTKRQATQVAIETLAVRHERAHGKGCYCREGDGHGEAAAEIMNDLAAAGMEFDSEDSGPPRSQFIV